MVLRTFVSIMVSVPGQGFKDGRFYNDVRLCNVSVSGYGFKDCHLYNGVSSRP